MAQKKLIQEELESLNTLKELAESYEEIAAMQMQKIKDSVLKTRDFLSELSEIFVDLKASYQREVEDLMKRIKKGEKHLLPTLKKKKKTLMVYLSSNGRLYGSVTRKTYNLLVKDLKEKKGDEVDLLVIGAAGREMLDQSDINTPFEYYDLPDTKVSMNHIKMVMKKYLQYEKVHVYYGKFGNVVKQDAISSSISGEDIFEAQVRTVTPKEDKFIFEPMLQEIFHFFETQIMATLFSQTLLENQLARHASRVNAMEEALLHIEEEGKRLNIERIHFRHAMQNKKILESVAGFSLWNLS